MITLAVREPGFTRKVRFTLAFALAPRLPADGEKSPWNVLAYEVTLKARGATLSKEDFADAVKNFTAYGKVAVVLYHADTDAAAHPDSRKAHAWITELRVGSMTRAGKKVATLEARFEWINEATRADVESGALSFGSVTIIQNAVDEETDENVGTVLYSFSLTNNPALKDLPALAASGGFVSRTFDGDRENGHAVIEAGYWYGDLDSREDVLAMLRCVFDLPITASQTDCTIALARLEELVGETGSGVDTSMILSQLRSALRLPALTTVSEVCLKVREALTIMPSEASQMSRGALAAQTTGAQSMSTFILLAASLGIPAPANEDAARAAVLSLGQEAVDVRRALGFTSAHPTADIIARVSTLSTDAALLPGVRAELNELKDATELAAAGARKAHIDALCVDQSKAQVRASLEMHAKHDWPGFVKQFPLPAVAANAAQLASDLAKAQEAARGASIAPKPGEPQPHESTPTVPQSARQLREATVALAAELREKDPKLSASDSVVRASKQLANAAKKGR